MVLDGEPSTDTPLRARKSVTVKFECMIFKIPKVPVLTISGLIMTFDLLTSKSNQFIFVPNCTQVVNLVKFP